MDAFDTRLGALNVPALVPGGMLGSRLHLSLGRAGTRSRPPISRIQYLVYDGQTYANGTDGRPIVLRGSGP